MLKTSLSGPVETARTLRSAPLRTHVVDATVAAAVLVVVAALSGPPLALTREGSGRATDIVARTTGARAAGPARSRRSTRRAGDGLAVTVRRVALLTRATALQRAAHADAVLALLPGRACVAVVATGPVLRGIGHARPGSRVALQALSAADVDRALGTGAVLAGVVRAEVARLTRCVVGQISVHAARSWIAGVDRTRVVVVAVDRLANA